MRFIKDPDEAPVGDSASPPEALFTEGDLEERIQAALRSVYDPEIPVNIYDLGLIYDVRPDDNGHVDIDMTLTAPACPVAGQMPGMVEAAVMRAEGVKSVKVELVWDPPWSQERMSDEARLELGMM
jgi:FeS assembly SUF system protein